MSVHNPLTKVLRVALLGVLVSTAQLGFAREPSPEVFWDEGASASTPGRPDSFAELAERLAPAVVFIEGKKAEAPGPQLRLPFPFRERDPFRDRDQDEQKRPRSTPFSGSGFVVSRDGYIVTNFHVVEQATDIKVGFLDGTKLTAEVVGRDPNTDLALLKVNAKGPLVTVPLGNSDAARVGDWVVAVGNPLGLDHSVTVGILSAKGRSIGRPQYDDFLQTDASINPGNSGGPLIDTAGRVIGVNTAMRVDSFGGATGIGFAIPINLVKSLLPQLKKDGLVTRGWLGVAIQKLTPTLATAFKLEDTNGALVGDIYAGSPAEGKIQRGDVIVQFNGFPIKTMSDLPKRVAETPPGSRVDIVVVRDGKRKVVKTTIERRDEKKLAGNVEQPDEPAAEDPRTL